MVQATDLQPEGVVGRLSNYQKKDERVWEGSVWLDLAGKRNPSSNWDYPDGLQGLKTSIFGRKRDPQLYFLIQPFFNFKFEFSISVFGLGHGPPRPDMAHQGRPWPAMAGH